MKSRLWWIVLCVWMAGRSPASDAKTIEVETGAILVNQLHEELVAQFPQWRGTPTERGFTDPLLQVESSTRVIRLTVPDETDEAAVRAVITAHVPHPSREVKRQAFVASGDAKLKALGLTNEEIAARRER